MCVVFFFYGYDDHRDLLVLTHSFPTRRASDLLAALAGERKAEVVPCGRRQQHRDHGKPLEAGEAASRLRQTRSEEHTSELQSLMRISYAVFCLKKKIPNKQAQSCV